MGKGKQALAALAAACLLLSACSAPAAVESATPDPHAGQVEVTTGSGSTRWVTLYENMPVSPYDKTCFSADGQYIDYSDGTYTSLRGVDVSYFQGEIDWTAVAKAGIDFAMIRLGYRGWKSGALSEDEQFAANLKGAQAAGLKVGVYFFSQATSVAEAAEEAAFTLERLDGVTLDMPVVFDWERLDSQSEARTNAVTGDMATTCAKVFCDTVEQAGFTPGVYVYQDVAYNGYDLDKLADYFIWSSETGTAPYYYYKFEMWQYSFEGAVDGIDHKVDLNLYFVKK